MNSIGATTNVSNNNPSFGMAFAISSFGLRTITLKTPSNLRSLDTINFSKKSKKLKPIKKKTL